MRTWAALSILVLLAAGLPPASPASAGSSEDDLQIDVERTISGANTYLFSIRIDPSTGDPDHFEISNDSHFTVKAYYDRNGTQQEATGVRGVLEYNSGLDCAPRGSNHVDPCFMDASGVRIQDLWDARVEAGGFTFENDPDLWAWESATGSINWTEDQRFELPHDANQLTVRFFMSIPGAEWIDVDVHIHSPQDISMHHEVANDGGFAVNGEDFDPTLGVDTAPASVLVDGREQIQFDGEENHRLYATFGPAWRGLTTAGNIAVSHNAFAASNIAYEAPDGERTSRTALAAGGSSGILVPGSNEVGTHSFEVNTHAGVGPQDIYLIGYKGPTS